MAIGTVQAILAHHRREADQVDSPRIAPDALALQNRRSRALL